MTCPFVLDDGVYVLGALRPSERANYERHLSECSSCRECVAALAVLPGLLGRLDAATASGSAVAPTTQNTSILARTLAAVAAARRTQRRRRAFVGSVLAVWLAVAAGLVIHFAGTDTNRSVPMTAMWPASGLVPITAEIGLRGIDGGTEIRMLCRYGDDYTRQWVVRLVVYSDSGGGTVIASPSPGADPNVPSPSTVPVSPDEGEQISTWTAAAHQQVSLTAVTHLSPDDIDRIEIQRGDHFPLLIWTPD